MPKKKKGSGFTKYKAGNLRNTGGRKRKSLGTVSAVLSGDGQTEGIPGSLSGSSSSAFEKTPFPGNIHKDAVQVGSSSGQADATVPLLKHEDAEAVSAETLLTLTAIIPTSWKVIQDREGFHVLCFSQRTKNIQVQREVYASFDGTIDIFVHKKEISGTLREDIMKGVECVPLNSLSQKVFTDNVCKIVSAICRYEVCAGVDLAELQDLWASDTSGKIDDNPYCESRYEKSFRSHECCLLVTVSKWRCTECHKALDRQKQRII